MRKRLKNPSKVVSRIGVDAPISPITDIRLNRSVPELLKTPDAQCTPQELVVKYREQVKILEKIKKLKEQGYL